jgi:hypothetical protein
MLEDFIQKKHEFRESYNGTELYISNSLFDMQFWQEFPAED